MLIAPTNSVIRHAKRVPEALGTLVPRVAAAPGGELVGMGARAGGGGAGQVLEEGVEHWHVVDEDGDEGFADGPFAGLFGAVGAGLGVVLVGGGWGRGRGVWGWGEGVGRGLWEWGEGVGGGDGRSLL